MKIAPNFQPISPLLNKRSTYIHVCTPEWCERSYKIPILRWGEFSLYDNFLRGYKAWGIKI
jgi:hypothetical protein